MKKSSPMPKPTFAGGESPTSPDDQVANVAALRRDFGRTGKATEQATIRSLSGKLSKCVELLRSHGIPLPFPDDRAT